MEQDIVLNDEARELLERAGLELVREPQGLTLSDGTMKMCVDLRDALPRIQPGKLKNELLVRAAKLKGATGELRAIDATAGLGEDSLLLAASGFDVTLFEANPVIAALLEDALRRAQDDPDLADIAYRMHLHTCDSVAALQELAWQPDVVYLDPMFPERKKSAAVKKKFQLLHHLEHYDSDEESLMQAARCANPRKLVIKRPVKGPYLGGIKPNYSLRGKAVRYDVLLGV